MALQIEVKSNSRQARSDLSKLNRSVDQIATTTTNMANKLQKSVAILSTGIAGLVAGKAITNVTDSYRRLEARIALTNKSVEAQAIAFKEINKIALETRSSQESLADLYSRIGRATKVLGVEQKTVIQVTRSIAQAITISGSSAESANSAIVQLGQGLAAGALRGQELNSVMEQTPAVAQAIARGMGITIGQLREFANEGKLSAQAVVDALSGQAEAIDAEFARIPVTVAQGLLVLGTGAGRVVNEVDSVLGASRKMTSGFQSLGNALNNNAVGIGKGLRSFISGFSSFKAGLDKVLFSLGILSSATQFFIESVIGRLIPTSVLFQLTQFKNQLVLLLNTFKELFIPSTRLSDTFIILAGRIDLAARAVRIGPFERLQRFLGVSFLNTIDAINTVILDFTLSGLRSLLLFSRGVGLAVTQAGFSISAFAVDLGRLGSELGGLFGVTTTTVASSLLKLGEGFRAVGQKLRTLFIETIGTGIATALIKISKAVSSQFFKILDTLISLFARGKRKLGGDLFDSVGESFTTMLDGVIAVSRKIGKAFAPIEEFVEKVNHAFWWVMDKVVGNSWWPDLVDGVIEYSKYILDALEPIILFSKRVSVIFANLAQEVPEQVKMIASAVVSLFLPVINFAVALVNVISSLFKGVSLEVEALNTVVRFGIFSVLAMVSPILAAIYTIANVVGFLLEHVEGASRKLSTTADRLTASLRSVTGQFDILKDGTRVIGELNDKFKFLERTIIGIKGLLEVVRPLLTAFSDTFGSSITLVAAGLIAAFTLPFKAIAVIAAALLKDELLGVINTILSSFGTNLNQVLSNLGNVGGQIAASLVKAIPEIVGLLGEITAGFVNGFLDSFGIIGDVLRSIFNLINTLTFGLLSSLGSVAGAGILYALFLGKTPGKILKGVTSIIGNINSIMVAGTLTKKDGMISTMLFGASGGAGLFGRVKSSMAPVFGHILTGIAGMTSSLLKAIPALSGVFSFFSFANLKSIAAGFTLVNIQAMIASFSFTGLAASMLTTMKSVIATTTAIISQTAALAAMIVRNGIAIAANLGLTLSFSGLVGVFFSVANAARTMWVAISGPLAPFMIALLALMALFGSATAMADETENSLEKLDKRSNQTRNKLANLFGLGVDLNIEPNLDPATVEETFDVIKDANEATLYAMNRQVNDSFWFMEWVDNMATFLNIQFTKAIIAFTNRFKLGANAIIMFMNDVFGTSFKLFVFESRSAVEKILDGIDPDLRLKLRVNAEELEEFTDAETRGLFAGTVAQIADLKAEIEDAEGLLAAVFSDKNAIADLNAQLREQERALQSVTQALEGQVISGKRLQFLGAIYDGNNARLEEATTHFGKQILQGKSLLDIQRLTAKQQQDYVNLIGQAEEINARIRIASASGVLSEQAKKDEVAAQLKLFKEVEYQIGQIGVALESFSNFDLATDLGLDERLIAKLQGTDIGENSLKSIVNQQQKIIDKEREIQELRRKDPEDLAGVDLAQAQLVSLKREGEVLVVGAERSLMSMFDKMTTDLANSDITISNSEFLDLNADLQAKVLNYADILRGLNIALAESAGDPVALNELQKGRALVLKEMGKPLGKDIDFSLLDNFSQALDAFSQVGINFDVDTLSKLGPAYTKVAVAEAQKLADMRLAILDESYSATEIAEGKRLEDIFAYNQAYSALEKKLREDREDALLNEQTAATLGQGFGDAIVGAMTGKSDFGETMATLITNKLEQGLADRIADFAEGFLDAFFSAFQDDKGIGGGLAEALVGPTNEEGNELGEKGEGMFDGLKAMFQEDGAFSGLTTAFKSITGSFSGIFDGLLGGMGGIFDGLLGGLSGALDGIMGMFGGGGGGGGLGGLLQMGMGLFGFAEGGAVRGPGTGTSDSIMAKLSNGEFVINAASTKKFRPMLEAINSGQMEMPAFADGGAVDLQSSSNKVMKEVAGRPSNNNQQTVQNINITGDISRQTKKEIFGMLPQIATGVNQQNREQNR